MKCDTCCKMLRVLLSTTLVMLFLAMTYSPSQAIERHDIVLRVLYYDDVMEIPTNKRNGKAIYQGWARWYKNGICIIWVPRPSGTDDMTKQEIMGHELRHCIEGYFHPPYKNVN